MTKVILGHEALALGQSVSVYTRGSTATATRDDGCRVSRGLKRKGEWERRTETTLGREALALG